MSVKNGKNKEVSIYMTDYVVEKGIRMPLCCVKDGVYFNYLDGQVIEDENVLNFIKEGLKRKSMKIMELDFAIYRITSPHNELSIIYNYQLNGTSNYLDGHKQPLPDDQRRYIINELMMGKLIQEKIWGDDDEIN